MDAAPVVNNARLGKQGGMLWVRRKRWMVEVQAKVTPNQDGFQPQVRLLIAECKIRQRLVGYLEIHPPTKEKIETEDP